MGFRFRKSLNFGPFRINFSKSGIGYSFGGKGFRVTKTATGKTRTTASIPGTGISYVQETSGSHSSGSYGASSTGGNIKTPAPKKPKKRKWPYIVGALLVVGAIGSTMDGNESEPNTASPEDNTSISANISSNGSSASLEDEIEIDTSSSAPSCSASSAESVGSTSQTPADPEPQAQTPEEPTVQEPAEPASDSEPEPQAPAAVTTTPAEPSSQAEPSTSSQSSGTQNTQSRTVYVTPTGKRYHYDGNCNGGTYIESTLDQALARGLTPCKKCAGG